MCFQLISKPKEKHGFGFKVMRRHPRTGEYDPETGKYDKFSVYSSEFAHVEEPTYEINKWYTARDYSYPRPRQMRTEAIWHYNELLEPGFHIYTETTFSWPYIIKNLEREKSSSMCVVRVEYNGAIALGTTDMVYNSNRKVQTILAKEIKIRKEIPHSEYPAMEARVLSDD